MRGNVEVEMLNLAAWKCEQWSAQGKWEGSSVVVSACLNRQARSVVLRDDIEHERGILLKGDIGIRSYQDLILGRRSSIFSTLLWRTTATTSSSLEPRFFSMDFSMLLTSGRHVGLWGL
jgi:hypothetical protein